MLDEYRSQIIAEVDGVALRVGRLLREAKALAPDGFRRWVDDELPFGFETARRLMAISAAYEKLPEETLATLPKPWQALYAIRSVPIEQVQRGIAEGALGPETTVRQAVAFARSYRSDGRPSLLVEGKVGRADVAAGLLMQNPPSSLSDGVATALAAWLDRR